MIDPRASSDVDGRYPAANGKVGHSSAFTRRTIFSGWDVFRSQFPLQTIINPKVVIEVLSESTEAYDRGDKFSAYRDLSSLEEYVLVSQTRPMIETYLRQSDGAWLISTWEGLKSIAPLRSVGIDVALAEVYAGLAFGAA